jgi:fatty acid desaturase
VSLPSLDELVRGSDFAGLRRQISATRLLERRYTHYAVLALLTLAAYVGTWWLIAWLQGSWFELLAAALLGIVFTQVAFLGHDAGHQQVVRSKRRNDVLGIVAGDLLIGLSYRWWLDKHNRHHARPNHEGYDPDIGDGVLAFTSGQVADRTGAFGRWVIRRQAWLFFPLLTLEGLHLHVASVLSLREPGPARYRLLERILFTVHFAAYVIAIFTLMSPVTAVAFIAVHQATFGLYMGCSFAPNHKGMPTFAAEAKVDYLRRQVLTSRNIRGGKVTDFLLGGLNYQIEHHLFPNMPRPNLREAQRLVRAYCHEHRVHYTEVSVVESYRAALTHLHDLGEPLRRTAASLR